MGCCHSGATPVAVQAPVPADDTSISRDISEAGDAIPKRDRRRKEAMLENIVAPPSLLRLQGKAGSAGVEEGGQGGEHTSALSSATRLSRTQSQASRRQEAQPAGSLSRITE